MILQAIIVGALVAALILATPRAVDAVRGRWFSNDHGECEECEVCGRKASRILVAVDSDDNDDALGISALGGQTAMAATYCRRHAPTMARRL